MSNLYDDINYCMNLLYEYVYSKKNCYKLVYESKIELDISLLKKDSNFKYQSVLSEKIKFLKYNYFFPNIKKGHPFAASATKQYSPTMTNPYSQTRQLCCRMKLSI